MPKRYKTKLSRKVAMAKLQGVIERAARWNEELSNWYYIQRLVLFGSLARNEAKVGDIDLCIETFRVKNFSEQEREDYIEWRADYLGYAPPKDFMDRLFVGERDVPRFLKNRDGRIELLSAEDQLPAISLTLQPQADIIINGELFSDSAIDVINSARPITRKEALELIESGHPEPRRPEDGEFYWNSYCNALRHYPTDLRRVILQRDGNEAHFQE